ncbi:DUF3795 domain-containing protein [Dehalobacter sp.]|uniref:DUF3795 domain-containing protein n=1 Tax=Dehalobacter sp. TaxID=1962289 RepID=UPI0002F04EEA|nr:DUF3795 domain-containing protein [Dehalobacter sp.]MCG1024493.1 DUF3795 domain-containing protein [Dehalobacter sp.]
MVKSMVSKEYRRKCADFSLCGLNCCLCPRFHTDGSSKCPGCEGPDFFLKHPSCAVITCNKKHQNVEYCFECSVYPCERYQAPSEADSFISYQNVLQDQAKAKMDLQNYLEELTEKHKILGELIANYNDGKLKGFYCLAVNLLPLSVLNNIMDEISHMDQINCKGSAEEAVRLLKAEADRLNIQLVLRKAKKD